MQKHRDAVIESGSESVARNQVYPIQVSSHSPWPQFFLLLLRFGVWATNFQQNFENSIQCWRDEKTSQSFNGTGEGVAKVYNLGFFAHASCLLSKIIVSITPTPQPSANPFPAFVRCSATLYNGRSDCFHSATSSSSLPPVGTPFPPWFGPTDSFAPLVFAFLSLAALRNHLIKSISDSSCSIACHLIQSSR